MGNVPGHRCEECRKIARALHVAWRADSRALRTRLREVATSSGRDPRQFGISWVFSVANMPDGEMKALLESHYPTVAQANRTREQHESASGHSLGGWWSMSQYSAYEAD